ncbi:hypothetical protein CL614_03515 [archaeon]|jgi:hypothetical protein|nr:hypothetical protein [archaeon]|tara:strand:+ start:3012 stop:3308 length:297 start_codon:yes stop_codon:yes gene_type:complete
MANDKHLTAQQEIELEQLYKELMNLATEVVLDYEENPSETSGSVTEVHMDSPILDNEDYPYNTEFGDGMTPEEMNEIDEENQISFEDQATKDRKRRSG